MCKATERDRRNTKSVCAIKDEQRKRSFNQNAAVCSDKALDHQGVLEKRGEDESIQIYFVVSVHPNYKELFPFSSHNKKISVTNPGKFFASSDQTTPCFPNSYILGRWHQLSNPHLTLYTFFFSFS